jgi:hypothetical protein
MIMAGQSLKSNFQSLMDSPMPPCQPKLQLLGELRPIAQPCWAVLIIVPSEESLTAGSRRWRKGAMRGWLDSVISLSGAFVSFSPFQVQSHLQSRSRQRLLIGEFSEK